MSELKYFDETNSGAPNAQIGRARQAVHKRLNVPDSTVFAVTLEPRGSSFFAISKDPP